jgi:hypothetical protein
VTLDLAADAVTAGDDALARRLFDLAADGGGIYGIRIEIEF